MPSSSLGGTVIEIRVPRGMWDPESEWEGWGTVVRVSRHKETSLMGTGPAATAQKRLTDMSVIRYVPFFFFFSLGRGGGSDLSLSLILGWQYQWNTLITHTTTSLLYVLSYSSMPFSPITLFTQLVLLILMLFCFVFSAI